MTVEAYSSHDPCARVWFLAVVKTRYIVSELIFVSGGRQVHNVRPGPTGAASKFKLVPSNRPTAEYYKDCHGNESKEIGFSVIRHR
jgi:hypothetical protein